MDNTKLTKENILSRSNSYEILSHFLRPYAGEKKLTHNRLIKSPFREERTASFCIYQKGQEYLFKDHGGTAQGSAIDLVMELHKLDFKGALALINQELGLGLSNKGNTAPAKLPPRKIPQAPKVEEDKRYYLKPGSWRPEELNFWARFGITKLSLDAFEVAPVEDFSAMSSKGKPFRIQNREGLMFSYKVNEDCYKIYRPGQKQMKFLWAGKKPESYVFGYNQLPDKGEYVIFTGGEKDVLTLHSLGFHAICLNSETAIPSKELLEDLRHRFNMLSLYDNDKTGIAQAKKLQEKAISTLQLPSFTHPSNKKKGKDISDWIDFGQDKKIVETLIENLFEDNLYEPTPAEKEKPNSKNVSATKKEKADLPKKSTKLSQRNNTRKKSGTDNQKTNNIRTLRDPYTHITQLESLYTALGIAPNADFIQDGAELVANYFDIKSNPHRIYKGAGQARTKVAARRAIGTDRQINSAYLPPALRDKTRTFLSKALIICHSELDAYILSELGILAIGISHPLGFLTSPKGARKAQKLVTEVKISHKVERIIYLIPVSGFVLPKYERSIGGGGQYEHKDAARNAQKVLDALSALQEVFTELKVEASYPVNHTEFPSKGWLEMMIRSLIKSPTDKKYLAPLIHRELISPHRKDPIFSLMRVSTGGPGLWRQPLRMDSAGSFAAFHGIEALGTVFTWGKNIYEYDSASESIIVKGTGREIYSVKEGHGCYIGESRGKDRVISTFLMSYILEIKEEDPRYLVEFTHLTGAKTVASFTSADILNESQFKKLILALKGAKYNYLGSKTQLEEIHSFSRDLVPEAVSLSNHLGLDKENGFYVYGNGILDRNEGFIAADETGVVKTDIGDFYIAAAAQENIAKDDFRAERGFFYNQEGTIDFKSWAKLYIKVHGKQGHAALVSMISALYRDIFREIGKQVYPHFFIHGLAGSGKSSAIKHLYGFFGSIPETSLKAGATRASFDRKIEQFRGAILPINEMDVKQEYVKKLGLIQYFVGVYDYQGREKTVNGKSKQALPQSALFLIGQEAIWHLDALSSRCIIQYYPGENIRRSQAQTESFQQLEILSETGYSHLMKPFFLSRDLIKEKLRDAISELQDLFIKEKIKNATARMIENYAMTLAPLLILIREKIIEYPISEEKIINHYISSLKWQVSQMVKQGVLSILFQFIASEYGPKKTFNHQNVYVTTTSDGEQVVRIRLQSILHKFDSYVKRENLQLENTSKNDIRAKLKNHPAFLREAAGLQVGYRIREGGYIQTGNSGKPVPYKPGSSCIELNLSKIEDFDLPAISWVDTEAEPEPTQSIF